MSTRKPWQRNEVIELISIYKERPMLWNTKDREHRNREKKMEILNEIAMKFECSIEEIQRKIHNLRNQMSQELKKIRKKAKSGNGTDDVTNICSWPYFQALQFLAPVLISDNIPAQYTETSISVQRNEEIVMYPIKSEKNVEGDEETVRSMQSEKKRKRDSDIEDRIYQSALKTVKQEFDEYDKFGEYVALELKSLKSYHNKALLRHEIRKVIVRIAAEDLYATYLMSSNSTPMQSPDIEEEYY